MDRRMDKYGRRDGGKNLTTLCQQLPKHAQQTVQYVQQFPGCDYNGMYPKCISTRHVLANPPAVPCSSLQYTTVHSDRINSFTQFGDTDAKTALLCQTQRSTLLLPLQTTTEPEFCHAMPSVLRNATA